MIFALQNKSHFVLTIKTQYVIIHHIKGTQDSEQAGKAHEVSAGSARRTG